MARAAGREGGTTCHPPFVFLPKPGTAPVGSGSAFLPLVPAALRRTHGWGTCPGPTGCTAGWCVAERQLGWETPARSRSPVPQNLAPAASGESGGRPATSAGCRPRRNWARREARPLRTRSGSTARHRPTDPALRMPVNFRGPCASLPGATSGRGDRSPTRRTRDAGRTLRHLHPARGRQRPDPGNLGRLESAQDSVPDQCPGDSPTLVRPCDREAAQQYDRDRIRHVAPDPAARR